MRAVGFILLAIGVGLIASALMMDVGIDSGAELSGFPDRVANADLMNVRLVHSVIGVGAFLSGWLALILDQISGGEKRRKAATDKMITGQA